MNVSTLGNLVGGGMLLVLFALPFFAIWFYIRGQHTRRGRIFEKRASQTFLWAIGIAMFLGTLNSIGSYFASEYKDSPASIGIGLLVIVSGIVGLVLAAY